MNDTPPPSPHADDPGRDLDVLKLTWSALIGRWVEFARSAVALPTDRAGKRMREAVPSIIMLQAVYFAVQHLEELSRDEQALGLDRAELLLDEHRGVIEKLWHGDSPPGELSVLIHDAETAITQARQKVDNGA